MKKFTVGMVSVLATLGVSAGAVAVVNNAPATKGKLNVSYGDTTIVGDKNQSTNEVTPTTDIVAVSYVNGETTTVKYQNKNSLVEMFDVPSKLGHKFAGWSTSESGDNLVFVASDNLTLYPVFIANEVRFNYHKFNSTGLQKGAYLLSGPVTIYNETVNYTLKNLGYAETEESIECVTSFEEDKEYYQVYYVPELNKIVSYTEAKQLDAIVSLGERAYININVHSLEGDKTMYLYELQIYAEEVHEYKGGLYDVIGYAETGNTTEYLDMSYVIREGTEGMEVYLVFKNRQTAEVFTYEQITASVDLFVNRYDTVSLMNYEDSITRNFCITIDGLEFWEQGYSVSRDSKESLGYNPDMIFLSENNITYLCALYLNPLTDELLTAEEVKAINDKRIATTLYYYNNGGQTVSNPKIIDLYNQDVELNGEIYSFVGWSISATGTSIVDLNVTRSKIYAVYMSPEGTLLSYNAICAIEVIATE